MLHTVSIVYLSHDQLSATGGTGSRLSLTTLTGNGKEQEITKRSQ